MTTRKKGVAPLDLTKLHEALSRDGRGTTPRTPRVPSRATPRNLPPLQKTGSNLTSTSINSLNKHDVLPHTDPLASVTAANVPDTEIQEVESMVHIPGGAQRTKTLYLSRATTKARLVRRGEDEEVQGDGEDVEGQDGEEEDQVPELPAFNKPEPNPGLSKEFTFTGYDIMSDVPPPSPELDPEEAARRRQLATYHEICRQLDVIPTSFIENRLLKKEIRMRSHGLGAAGARALAVTLVENDHVYHLDLSDNNVGSEGALAVAQMLTANATLTELLIGDNDIGFIGGSAICLAAREKQDFRKLSLAGNKLRSDDGLYIADMIENNFYLRELILSHNQLEDDGAIAIGNSLVQNDTLEVLDLSWNCIRGNSAVAIAFGLARNSGLKVLNVSWNGFGRIGCQAMSSALTKNSTLQELDLRCNRVYMEDVATLLKGLEANQTLTSIKLGMNPITPQGAMMIVKKMEKMEDSPIRDIDLSDIVVTSEFETILKEVQEKRTLRVHHGISIRHRSSPVMDGEVTAIFNMDPRALVFQMMEAENLRVVDLFKRLDDDNSMSLTRDEFKQGILGIGLPITEDQLDRIVDLLDADGDGTVDLGELIAAERMYKRNKLKRKMKQAAKAAKQEQRPTMDGIEIPRMRNQSKSPYGDGDPLGRRSPNKNSKLKATALNAIAALGSVKVPR